MELIKRYKRLLGFLVVLSLCTIIAILSGTSEKSLLIEKIPISNKKCPQIKVWQIAFLKWNDLIKLEIEEWQPPVTSAFNYNAYPLKMAELFKENPGLDFLMECWNDDPASANCNQGAGAEVSSVGLCGGG